MMYGGITMTPKQVREAADLLEARDNIDAELSDKASVQFFIAVRPQNCAPRPAGSSHSASRLCVAAAVALKAERDFLTAELEKLGVTG
jgi:hypothetical protein